jgi:FtsH-binding integral membrane protein
MKSDLPIAVPAEGTQAADAIPMAESVKVEVKPGTRSDAEIARALQRQLDAERRRAPAAPPNGGGRQYGHGLQYVADMEASIRMGFVSKVFGILAVQLLITFAVVLPFSLSDSMGDYIRGDGRWLYWVGMFVGLASLCVLICSPGLAQRTPHNYIFLLIFSVCQGVMLGLICSLYTLSSVAAAMAGTLVLTAALVAYARCTTSDFTGYGPYLYVSVWVLILWGIMAGFCVRTEAFPMIHTVYCAAGILLFSFFIVHDTQLIIGGKHKKYQFSTDMYVFAALNLYLDVLNLFLMILSLGGDRR